MTKPGIAALVICCGGCGLFGLALWRGLASSHEVYQSADAWCQSELAEAMQPWSATKLVSMAAGPLLQQVPPTRMQILCSTFQSNLGNLVALGNFQRTGFDKVVVNGTEKPAVRLVYRAQFQKVDAAVDIRVIRDGRKWKLAGLQINP